MSKKYVVFVHDSDGIHQKNHTELQRAVNYVGKQLGKKVCIEEVQLQLDLKKPYIAKDDWGRVIEILHLEVGSCKVCKKSNTGLFTVLVDSKWQYSIPERNKVREPQKVPVCLDCMFDFECGVWGVIYANGTHKVVKN